jgi:outer membrane lipoprotein SlyB
MRTVSVGVLLAALAVAGCASSQGESQALAGYDFGQIDKIAIVEVTGHVYGDAVKNQISYLFTMELMKKGYKFIERKDIKTLLKEHEFQASDLTTTDGAAQTGKILNVPAVMLIDIPKYRDEKMEMSAKLIDVQDGTILWIGTGSGSTGKTLSTLVGAGLGAAVGAAVAGGDSRDRVVGGVIGGVAGGVAGNVLSPEQSEQVKKVIAKVVASLPPRIPQLKSKK